MLDPSLADPLADPTGGPQAAARQHPPTRGEIFAALEPVTGPLSEGARRALESHVGWIAVPRGTEIITEGQVGDCLYVVVRGRLEVLVASGPEVLSVGEVGVGESVGESALLTREPRSATVRVLRDAELLRLTREGFDRLLASHPEALASFARVLAARMQRGLRQREPIRQLGVASLVTVEECAEVAATENLVLRNLKITHTYHRLSLDIARLTGQRDANWCTFATSASKTAGYSIRAEELPLIELWRWATERPRGGATLRRVGDGLTTVAERLGAARRGRRVLDEVSRSISEGNLKVFAELAPLFSRFVATFHDDTTYDRAGLITFCDEVLRHGPTETGGQGLLAEAFGHYHDAMFERSEKARAELMLLGNLKIGWHEQMRLQPQIARALDGALEVGFEGLMPGALGRRLEERMVRELGTPFRQLMTRSMMRLRLPRGDLRLGRDVPGVARGHMFPDVLRSLTNPELISLVSQLDADVDATTGSYATDWASIDQRMNFIADLFRTRQRSLDLFESPFEYDQRLEMASGRIPTGRL